MKDKLMNEIVVCPICGKKTRYGDIYWRDGKQMCEKCISKIWERECDKRNERI